MNTKQVIVVRKDLNMRKGKMCAQSAHASMAAILNLGSTVWVDEDLGGSGSRPDFYQIPLNNPALVDWLLGRFTKICVSVDSEQELLDVHQKAKDAGLICSLIQDAGLTEFGGVPTYTTVAIGPAESSNIDKITGHLKLL